MADLIETPKAGEKAAPASPSFEEAFEKLQHSVKRLESGELSLDEALKQFEEGVRWSRECQQYLAAAEQKVDLLTKVTVDGNPVFQNFQ